MPESQERTSIILEAKDGQSAAYIALAMELSGAPGRVEVQEADKKGSTLITATGTPQELDALRSFIAREFSNLVNVSNVPVRE